MLDLGHALTGYCAVCLGACLYAAPCGCGSNDCLDFTLGVPRAGVAAAA